jgi:F420H(2)-dependent quinone reductase
VRYTLKLARRDLLAFCVRAATDSQWDWVAEHTRTYLASGGTEGHESNGVHTLVLATTGRKTGQPRLLTPQSEPRA